jgi:hypothetical protein
MQYEKKLNDSVKVVENLRNDAQAFRDNIAGTEVGGRYE